MKVYTQKSSGAAVMLPVANETSTANSGRSIVMNYIVSSRVVQFALRNCAALMILLGIFVFGTAIASAQTDATAITSAVSTGFVGVATLCVSVGTFFGVYRMVKKIK
jgi:hypothetical protein